MFTLRSISGRINAGSVEVGTTATLIPPSGSNTLVNGRTLLLYNNGSNTVYIGASGACDTTRYPLMPGDEKGFDKESGVELYGVTESDTADIRYIEGE